MIQADDYRKMAIVLAADKVLGETHCTFDDLSISKICEEAHISRSTLYRSFSDKFEIPQWHFSMISNENLFRIGRELSWFEGSYRNSIEHRKLRHFYQAAFASSGRHGLTAFAEREYTKVLQDIVQENLGYINDELLFHIDYAVGAEALTISRWAMNGMKTSPMQLAKWTISCIPRRLYEAVNKPFESEP